MALLLGESAGAEPSSSSQATSGGKPYRIDMEGKLRDEADRFDLAKARQCLSIVQHFAAGMTPPRI